MTPRLRTSCLVGILSAIAFFHSVGPGAALEPRIAAQMRQLAPTDRMIQVCYLKLEDRLSRETRHRHVDRVVLDVKRKGHVRSHDIRGKGAAFRDDGNWYELAFACSVSPDHLHVTQLRYTVLSDRPIPVSEWDRLQLFP
ncbi:DUF930 domain-containing protein [Aureimonas sp. ME7]|uniref:DUF930 domain-containing protein n=1 Tax=Aureimonas sp. ME7 TaxID=2744252 RepID=UPI0015F5CF9E|nr:DUF930 domain-containing protein [Aureimonas sp. ME7]